MLQESILRSKYNISKLKKFSHIFNRYFRKYEKRILKYIEKYSGFKWKAKEIVVWLFEGYHGSISNPILLNVYNYNKKFVLFQLIRLLVRNILYDNNVYYKIFEKKGIVDSREADASAYFITKNIAKKIFKEKEVEKLCKKSEFDGLSKFIWDREQELEKEWNLNKTNLKAKYF